MTIYSHAKRVTTHINRSLALVLASSVLLAGPVKSEESPYCPSPYPPLGNIAFKLPPKPEPSKGVVTLSDCKMPLPLPEQDPEYVELVKYKETPRIKKLDLVCVDMQSFNDRKPIVQKVDDIIVLNSDELAKFLTFARVAAHLDWKADRINKFRSYLLNLPATSDFCPSPSNHRNYLSWLEQSEQNYRTVAQSAKPTNIIVEFIDVLDKLIFGVAVVSASAGQPEIAVPALALNRIVGFGGEAADILTGHFIRYWEISYENEVKYLSGISTYTNDFFVKSIYEILQEIPQETKKGKIKLVKPSLKEGVKIIGAEASKKAVLGAFDQTEIDKVEAQVAQNMRRFRAIAKVIPSIDSKAFQEGLQEGAVSMTPAQLQLYFSDRSYYSQMNACELVREELPGPQGPNVDAFSPPPGLPTQIYPSVIPVLTDPNQQFAKKDFLVYCNEHMSQGSIQGPINCDRLRIHGKKLLDEAVKKGVNRGCPVDEQVITRRIYELARQKYGSLFLASTNCENQMGVKFAPILKANAHLFLYDLSNGKIRELPNFHTQVFFGGVAGSDDGVALSPDGQKLGSFSKGFPRGSDPQDTYSITTLSEPVVGSVKSTRLVPFPRWNRSINLSSVFNIEAFLVWWPDSSGFFMPTTNQGNLDFFVYYDGNEVFLCN